MNWSQCYSASNNIHPEYPPLMSDGRNFAILDTTLNNVKLREQFGISNNYEYRQFLIKNGDSIIKQNQTTACDKCGYCPYNHSGNNLFSGNGNKYIFKSCVDGTKPFGYEGSDLKSLYMSREALQSRLFAPLL